MFAMLFRSRRARPRCSTRVWAPASAAWRVTAALIALAWLSASGCADSGSANIVESCDGQVLRARPKDPGQPGPWPVGALTTTLGGIRTEVWYPARPGSEQGRDPVIYDVRDHIPEADRAKVSDAESPPQVCACYRDLPLDTASGPYPIVDFIHGTAGFRTQNLENATHWASRGFVVVASDHPGIEFKDLVTFQNQPADQVGDARRVFAEFQNPTGDIAFLAGHVDTSRQGATGHSAGGFAASLLGDVAQVLIPIAGGTGAPPTPPASVLFIRGTQDFGDGRPGEEAQWNAAQPRKRSVLIARSDHLVGSSLCGLRDPNDPNRDLLDIIKQDHVAGIVGRFAGALFRGCDDPRDSGDPFLAWSRGVDILNYATAAVLEESLHCSASAVSEVAKIQSTFDPDIDLYREAL